MSDGVVESFITLKRRLTDKWGTFVAPLSSSYRLAQAVDLITRNCMQAGVIMPALRLYCSRRSHYISEHGGIITLSYDAMHTEYFPSVLYHELSHHIGYVLYGYSEHDATFYSILFTMLERDGYLDSYLLSGEYKKGVAMGKKLGLVPKSFNSAEFPTIADWRKSVTDVQKLSA